ncbi:Oxidoreductase [Rhizophlyctis rosea]|uniref:Mitochondrial intermembrane space import and assembly protein 40 n=1 Tax=Rhizophlyctis rosea TaxID=64517 RepID=A0AAD5X6B0_9FUNG|nr:Oxidoreductase [Rhizophlyctis rosea]
MSYARQEEDGKDILLFVTKEDHDSLTSSSSSDSPSSSTTSTPSASSSSKPSSQSEAYNEETGEINWDCPCLGPMTKPPCGEAFKAAFSCFVYSTEEPKGLDCVEAFKAMQDCFREHPEVYGDELAGDEDDDDEEEEEASGKGEDAAGSAAGAAVEETVGGVAGSSGIEETRA